MARTEIAHSQALILRAQKRLSYQQDVIAKLGFDSEPRYAETVHDVYLIMQAKLDLLVRQHRKLIDGKSRA